jgi:galactokinase
LPGIRALRDVTLEQLEEHRHRLTDILYKRCRHVLTENLRVREAVQAFETGEIGKIGKLMADSHSSLQNDYEVSCRELDIMVEISSRQRGVYGARMTGGGFGGCTINLVDAADAMEFQRRVAAEYESETDRRPDIYICAASQGVEAVDLDGGLAAGSKSGRETRGNT